MVAAVALCGCTTLSASEKTVSDGGDLVPFSAPDALAKTDLITPEQKSRAIHNGWWTLYSDDALNALVQDAFSGSPTIAQVRARFVQAQASASKSASSLFPQANISADRGSQRGDNRQASDFTLRGAASFEFDLWGKNHASAQSTSLSADAAEEDLHAAAITLSAGIVESWLRLLSYREQQRLLEKQIDLNRTILSLQEKRYEMGVSSALDVLQQQETLAQSQSLMPDIMAGQDLMLNRLAVLAGKSPSLPLGIERTGLPAPLPLPETGISSNLLGDRPDIVAAWLRLQSADWAHHAANLDRLPNFDLSATYATSATKISGLFETWLLDLVAGVAMPVIDGGNRKAEALRTQALADERFQAYRETVLVAVQDVEDALSKNAYQARKLKALQNQLDASKATLEQAQLAYAHGDSDYINVLRSISSVQSLERQIVQARLDLALDRVALFRALGGRSWAKPAMDISDAKTTEGLPS